VCFFNDPPYGTSLKLGAASITDDADPRSASVLTSFASLARAMGPERYMSYLEFILPLLLKGAALKPDISISSQLDEEHKYDDDDDWET